MIKMSEKRKLKDFSYFFDKYLVLKYNSYAEEYEIQTTEFRWIINSDMFPKFGDNKTYTFVKVKKPEGYTHHCQEDNYFYHESWFIPNDLLEDELFEI